MRYNLVKNLLSIDSNTDYVIYLHYSPYLDNVITGDTKIKIKYFLKNDIKKPKELDTRFDFCWTKKGVKKVYFEHPLFWGLKAKLLLDMSQSIPTITVNRTYARIVKFKFDNVWAPGQHLSDLIGIKLLQEKILTLHCGSFSDKETGKGYLVFGISNTGKSYTVFKALEEGYQYHSEDLTLVSNDRTIYTLPLISTQSDKLEPKNFALRFNLFLQSKGLWALIAPRIPTLKSFRSFVSKIEVDATSKLDKIFILERGDDSVKKLSKKEAFKKILTLNKIELAYYKDHIFRTYSYYNADFDVEDLYSLENKLISDIVKSHDCYLIRSNSPDVYFQKIHKLLV